MDGSVFGLFSVQGNFIQILPIIQKLMPLFLFQSKIAKHFSNNNIQQEFKKKD